MTDQPGEEYEALFRPEEPAAEPVVAPITETGRVFKSQGVHENEEALLALPTSRASKLRTLERARTSDQIAQRGRPPSSPGLKPQGHRKS